MTKTTTAAAAALAASIALAGCTPTTEQASTVTNAPPPTVWTGSPAPSGMDEHGGHGGGHRADTKPAASATLHQYILDNKIAEVPFRMDEPGTPNIDFPIPPDWTPAGDRTPDWAYGAIVYTKAVDPENPPFMYAIASKLTGNVDPAKVLEYAPAQLNSLPEFSPIGQPRKDSVGGFEAVDFVGTFVLDGKTRAVGQQTIVIPGKDAVFVLQLNAEAPEGQEQVVIDAARLINDKTTITLPS